MVRADGDGLLGVGHGLVHLTLLEVGERQRDEGVVAEPGRHVGRVEGEVDEAMTYAEQAVAVRPDHPNGTQCLALVTAATGRPEEAARLARTVGPMTAATYLDRFFAGVALALAEAQLGKGHDTLDALEALDALIATIDDAAVPVLASQRASSASTCSARISIVAMSASSASSASSVSWPLPSCASARASATPAKKRSR